MAYGVSADGSTVVGQGGLGNDSEAFIWDATNGMRELGDLPGGGFASQAYGVSADGSTVVGQGSSSNGSEAFIWDTTNGMRGLGDLPGGGFISLAYGVSADGSTVVGQGNVHGTEAFIWDATNGMTGLGDLRGGSPNSRAFGVSADGSTVVGRGISMQASQEAFFWDAVNGMLSLQSVLMAVGVDLTGWQLVEARGVSADGLTIVGWGTNPNGQREAYLARLDGAAAIPTPALLPGLVGMGIAAYRKRKLASSTDA